MNRGKILIVANETSLLTLLSIFLKSRGYQVLSAGDGRTALETVEENAPDLVLLDVVLPKVDGLEVCRRIKGDPSTQNVAVVFIGARETAVDLANGKEAGADAYITKPIKMAYLLERLQGCLAKVR